MPKQARLNLRKIQKENTVRKEDRKAKGTSSDMNSQHQKL